MIIANETRSRLSWMNSLTSIAPAAPPEPPRRDAVPVGARVIGNCPCARLIRSMNTSSSEASERVQVSVGSLAIGRDRGFERRLVAARDVQARAERRHHVDAGRVRRARRRAWSACAVPPRSRCRWRDATAAITSVDGAVREQLAIGDIGDLVTALGLVHVVGRDQHGEPVARRARGSRSRIRAAPWDRRRRSARRAAAAAGSAACRRRARAAASSRPTARRRAAPRGR